MELGGIGSLESPVYGMRQASMAATGVSGLGGQRRLALAS